MTLKKLSSYRFLLPYGTILIPFELTVLYFYTHKYQLKKVLLSVPSLRENPSGRFAIKGAW
jgi:hypothetical protein